MATGSPYSIPYWDKFYEPAKEGVSKIVDIFRTHLGEAGMSEVAPFIQKGVTSSARDITKAVASPIGTNQPKAETTKGPTNYFDLRTQAREGQERTTPPPPSVYAGDLLRARRNALPIAGAEPPITTEFMPGYGNPPPAPPGYAGGFLMRAPTGELVPATMNPATNMFEPSRTGPLPIRPDINFETMGQYGMRREREAAFPAPEAPSEVYRLGPKGELVPFRRYRFGNEAIPGSVWEPAGATVAPTPAQSPFYLATERGAIPIEQRYLNQLIEPGEKEKWPIEMISGNIPGGRGILRPGPEGGYALPLEHRFPQEAMKTEGRIAEERAKGEAELAKTKQLGLNRQDEIRLLAQVGKTSREQMAADIYSKTYKPQEMVDITGNPIPGAAEAHAKNVREFVDSLYTTKRQAAEKALMNTGKYSKEQINAFLDQMGY